MMTSWGDSLGVNRPYAGPVRGSILRASGQMAEPRVATIVRGLSAPGPQFNFNAQAAGGWLNYLAIEPNGALGRSMIRALGRDRGNRAIEAMPAGRRGAWRAVYDQIFGAGGDW